MRKPTVKPNHYSLAVRIRKRCGEWGDWSDKGQGEWIGLDHVQSQIRMLRMAYQRDMEVAFHKEGKYLDYNGKEIGRPIYYDKTNR